MKADSTVATSSALPYGAELTLPESVPAAVEGGEWTGHEFNTDSVAIGEGTTVEVTLTNSIDADEAPVEPGDDGEPGEPGEDDPGTPDGGDPLPRTGVSPWGALGAGLALIALGAGVYLYTVRWRRA